MERLMLVTVLLVTALSFAGCTDETSKTPVLAETPALANARTLAEAQTLAEAGSAEDQFILGNLYAEGKVVPNDFAEAAKWFRKAGDQGNAEALYSLGVIYANGFSGPVDFTEAYVSFCLAAKLGLETAAADCENLEGELSPEDLALANKNIEGLFEKTQLRE